MRILLPLAFLLVPVSGWAGYEFSISASSTDPHVNVATPTNGIRNLYLWATCIDDGLSAFEAGTTGTLPVYAFTPSNGVMNVGGASNLLLAVPGCPYGSKVNFLLGYWIVQDNGGTLCLGPSATNNVIGAVNCDGNPTLTQNPVVTGFSSSGGSPCSTGTAGCSSGGGGSSGSFGT
jgi:hypothetical protein